MADYPCFRRRTRCRSFPSSWCRHWKKSCLVRCHNTNFDRMPNHSSIRMLDKRESNSSIVSIASGRQAFIPTHKSCCQCQSNFINGILFCASWARRYLPCPLPAGFRFSFFCAFASSNTIGLRCFFNHTAATNHWLATGRVFDGSPALFT